jgi:valyl-tRNA synthetase
LFETHTELFRALAGAGDVKVVSTGLQGGSIQDGTVQIVTSGATVTLPLGQLVDLEAERARLAKELAAAQEEYGALETKLNNPGFTRKAPAKIVAAERERLAALRERIERLTQ